MKTPENRLQNLKTTQLFTRLFIFWLFKKRHKNTVCHIIKNEVVLFCHFGSKERWYFLWFMVLRTRDRGTTDRLVQANHFFDLLISETLVLITLWSLGATFAGITPCVVSKYEYKQHYGGAAKSRFLADQCQCEIPNGPPLRNGQKYKNPYTCEDYSCHCP